MVRDGLDRPAHHRRCARTAPGRSSAATTATSTSWTPTPASGSSPTSRPATSSRARPPSTPTATRSCTRGRATTSCGSSPSTGRARPRCCGRSTASPWRRTSGTTTGTRRPIILGDYMIVGSESSRFWVIKLNRSYDAAGQVQVDPEVVFTDAGVGPGGAGGQRRRARVGRELGRRLREHRLLRHLGRAHLGLRPQRPRRGQAARRGVPLLHRRRQRPDADRRRRGDALRRGRERPARASSHRGRAAHEARPEQRGQPDRVDVQRDDVNEAGHLRHAGDRRRHHRRHERRRPAHRARPRHGRGEVGAPARRSGLGQSR